MQKTRLHLQWDKNRGGDRPSSALSVIGRKARVPCFLLDVAFASALCYTVILVWNSQLLRFHPETAKGIVMVPIISLLIVLSLSLLLTRIATLALTYTGLSRQSAAFQVRSAFTGVGFTTNESENVVNHPVRRRVLLLLMLVGNAGIVTAISTLILGFVSDQEGALWLRIVLLAGGIAALFGLASSQWVDTRLSRLISWAIARYTRLDVRDYASMLHLAGEYGIGELYVQEQDWLAERHLKDLKLREEGVLVLGIVRKNGHYVGTPVGATPVKPGDTLILYGARSSLKSLDQRRYGIGGSLEHAEKVARQQRETRREQKLDPEQGAQEEKNKKTKG